MKHTGKQRIRPRLVVLLWIWAVLIFTVVDLFLNVTEFDDVRPQVRWYRAARFTAHKIVGEPYRERDDFAARPDRAAVAVVAMPQNSRPPSRVRVIDGQAPDARTAEWIVLRLRGFQDRTDDPVRRAAIDRAISRYTNRKD